MPWTPSDAERHTKAANTPSKRELWAKIANETLQRTGNEARAIREANAVISRYTWHRPKHKWLAVAVALVWSVLLTHPAAAQTHPAPNNGGGQGGNPISLGPVYYAPAAQGAAVDQSSTINAVIAQAAAAGGGTVVFGPGTYGVCAAPITIAATGPNYVNLVGAGQGTHITLQSGCSNPPQEILYISNSEGNTLYSNGGYIENLVLDGACTTKYVAYINGSNQTTFQGVQFANPAGANTIPGSAGIYMTVGNERIIGKTNWVTATNTCYNTGNLPAYGIYDLGGNDNFTGVIVVNFQTGIYSTGDNQFGPGTHIWGGCQFANGGCTYNAALRTNIGIQLQGAGYATGVEIDDPASMGIELVHSSANDRMVVLNTDCIFNGTPSSSQYCVYIGSGVVDSVVMGTVAPQLASAGYPSNIVGLSSSPGDGSVTLAANPYDPILAGDAPIIHGFAAIPAGSSTTPVNGCMGINGYNPYASCESQGWVVPYGCRVNAFDIGVDTAPGGTLTFTLYINGTATTMTGTISGTTSYSTGIVTSNPQAVPPNTTISIGVTSTGTTNATNARFAIMGCG